MGGGRMGTGGNVPCGLLRTSGTPRQPSTPGRSCAYGLRDGGLEPMEQVLEDAQRAGLVDQVGGMYLWL